VEGFHHLRDGDVGAGVNEAVVKLGGVGPGPCVGEGVELRLAGLAGGFAEEDVVIGVGVERGVEVFEVNGGVGEFPGVAQPTEIVAEEESVNGGSNSKGVSGLPARLTDRDLLLGARCC